MRFARFLIPAALIIWILGTSPAISAVRLAGTDFSGGASDAVGSIMGGELKVNTVYAQPTGGRSSMRASLDLAEEPKTPIFLHVKGRDDNWPAKCAIEIRVNDSVVFTGRNEFSSEKWQSVKFALPDESLKAGTNNIVITNLEAEGQVGRPPWFQVAECAVADEDFTFARNGMNDFAITLPVEKREFPEPLKPGQSPGFALRGMKGWLWTADQYLAEIPVMAKYGMTFLMNCYGSMCDVENNLWKAGMNRWWEDLPPAKKQAYEQVVSECQARGIEFCFSMNPNLWSQRPLDYDSSKDLDDLWKHYAWMQGLGVKWFNISLDDITRGIEPAGQSKVVNEIFRRLRENDPDANMIFTPTIYWGNGTPQKERIYLEVLEKELHNDVYLFWVGDAGWGMGSMLTRGGAESFAEVSGHRLILWDNYPVNNSQPTMHLGPLMNRAPDLCKTVHGYMANPLQPQTEAGRIPILTTLDYAFNPEGYDPMRSVGQAILHLHESPVERKIIRELVEMYPGFIVHGKPKGNFNPVRMNFTRILEMPHPRWIAENYIRGIEGFLSRMEGVFPDRYAAEKTTIRNDIRFMREILDQRYGE